MKKKIMSLESHLHRNPALLKDKNSIDEDVGTLKKSIIKQVLPL